MALDKTKLTLGGGVLTFNGVDVGYLKSPVVYASKMDKKRIDYSNDGRPMTFRGSLQYGESATLKAALMELKAENLKIALGGKTISTVSGAQVTVADTNYTMTVKEGGSDVQAFFLGENIAIDGDAPVLKKLNGDALTEGTDYMVDHALGWIYRIPEGGIASLGTVEVHSAKYTPPASKTIKMGVLVAADIQALQFVHTNKSTGYTHTVYMPKAEVDAGLNLSFNDGDLIAYDVTFEAVDDYANNPTYPLGYYKEAGPA